MYCGVEKLSECEQFRPLCLSSTALNWHNTETSGNKKLLFAFSFSFLGIILWFPRAFFMENSFFFSHFLHFGEGEKRNKFLSWWLLIFIRMLCISTSDKQFPVYHIYKCCRCAWKHNFHTTHRPNICHVLHVTHNKLFYSTHTTLSFLYSQVSREELELEIAFRLLLSAL